MRDKVFLILAVLGVSLAAQRAQEVMMESEVRGFSLPLYNRDQQLQARITGSRATFPDEERIHIYNLHAELYESGAVQSKVTSPEAVFYKSEQRLEVQSGVQIEHPQIDIQSEGMNWRIPQRQGEFRGKVIMTLHKPLDSASTREDQDVVIFADRLFLYLAEGKGIFYGKVSVRHSKGSVQCERGEIEFEPRRPERVIRFIAQGQVRWDSGKRSGRCHTLSHDWVRNRIFLQGQVVIEDEKHRLISERVVWDEENHRLRSGGLSRVEIVSEGAQR
ncbi:MAG: LPS export ABC transporter periplasmic protein LptC [Methylacidiphilales bacterium]|nr:LPS export ABC transporter periplasmic protein LptC [Candidatus Methylacidiphilales bacterium]MDW8349630.1 LPS export ABC transporter periplasmic protein LptC [Verrucomicrobiae bacterium]